MTAKLRGKRRWKHVDDLWGKVMALEIMLDSAHQRIRAGQQLTEKEVSKMLGKVRSILAALGHEQKTLARWIHPAPNQRIKKTKLEENEVD